MIARVVRSTVVEAVHDGAIAICDDQGRVVAAQGDIERTYFLRSVAKPFQASVSQSLGAALPPEWMAVACASHGGSPAHIATVDAMLTEAGLDRSALACPPAWPLSQVARHRVIAAGHRRPQPVWHNCSGKHAAMLRACVAQGWDVDGYLDPQHPLHLRIKAFLDDALGVTVTGPGVDGCGAPVWAASTRAIATGYARLGTDPAMREAWTAMHRFGALTAEDGAAPIALVRWTDTAAKLGAEGILGIATRRGIGLTIKAWDGNVRPLGPVAAALAGACGLASAGTNDHLLAELEAPVLGGRNRVGQTEATVELS